MSNRTQIKPYAFSGQNQFNRLWYIKPSELEQLYTLVGDRQLKLWINLQNMFHKTSQAITSIRYYPIKPDSYYGIGRFLKNEKEVIRIGGYKPILPVDQIKGRGVQSNVSTFRIGYWNVPKATSFVDLEPFCTIQLYLPFIDFVTLPVNEIRGKVLCVDYSIDFNTGMATAFVSVNDTATSDLRHVILIKSGKIAPDIAWGSDSGSENLKNAIDIAINYSVAMGSSAGQIAAGAAAKNPQMVVGGAGQAIGATLSSGSGMMSALQERYTRGGNVGGFSTLNSPSHPYVIINRPVLVNVDIEDYAHVYGLPLYEERVLSTVKGFTIIDDIHLTGFDTAYEEELQEIERLLKSGVHL